MEDEKARLLAEGPKVPAPGGLDQRSGRRRAAQRAGRWIRTARRRVARRRGREGV